MRHQVAILDTSAVLRMSELSEEDLPDQAVISAITFAELSVGPLVAVDEQDRATRLAHVQSAEDMYGDPLPFNSETARAFAQVAADIRRSGRKPQARAFDALIAATAVAARLPLYTFNPADLAGVQNLEIVALPTSSNSEPTV